MFNLYIGVGDSSVQRETERCRCFLCGPTYSGPCWMSHSEQISQNKLYKERNVRLMCNDAQLPGTKVPSTQQFPDSKYAGYSIPQCSTAPPLSPHTAPTAIKLSTH